MAQNQLLLQLKVESEMKYLGMTITKNIIRREDINISNCIAHMKKSLSHWLTRDLTIFGHFIISVILSKAEGISCHAQTRREDSDAE